MEKPNKMKIKNTYKKRLDNIIGKDCMSRRAHTMQVELLTKNKYKQTELIMYKD